MLYYVGAHLATQLQIIRVCKLQTCCSGMARFGGWSIQTSRCLCYVWVLVLSVCCFQMRLCVCVYACPCDVDADAVTAQWCSLTHTLSLTHSLPLLGSRHSDCVELVSAWTLQHCAPNKWHIQVRSHSPRWCTTLLETPHLPASCCPPKLWRILFHIILLCVNVFVASFARYYVFAVSGTGLTNSTILTSQTVIGTLHVPPPHLHAPLHSIFFFGFDWHFLFVAVCPFSFAFPPSWIFFYFF